MVDVGGKDVTDRRAVATALVRVAPETARAIREMAMAQPSVEEVGHVLSMYVGPDDVLVVVDVNFHDDTDTGEAAHAIAAIEKQVRARFPMIKRLFIASCSLFFLM